MKIFSAFILLCISHAVLAQTWNTNPNNWDNNPNNWNNNPNNWVNNPNNWANDPNNIQSKNGVYDNGGNRIGYSVQSPSGVVNIFDNAGNRIGYVPRK